MYSKKLVRSVRSSPSTRSCCWHFGWFWVWRNGWSWLLCKQTSLLEDQTGLRFFLTFSKDVGWIFLKQYYINMLIFLLAIVLFTALLLINDLRFHKVGAPVLTVIIVSARPLHCTPDAQSHNKLSIQVELQIIALFTLAAYSLWYEMLLTYVTCVLLLFVTAGIGIYLPEKVIISWKQQQRLFHP